MIYDAKKKKKNKQNKQKKQRFAIKLANLFQDRTN